MLWIMALTPSNASFAVGSIRLFGRINPFSPVSRNSIENAYFTFKCPYTWSLVVPDSVSEK